MAAHGELSRHHQLASGGPPEAPGSPRALQPGGDRRGRCQRAVLSVAPGAEAPGAKVRAGAPPHINSAAVVLDTPSRWMIEQASGPRNDGRRGAVEPAMRHFATLEEHGLTTDVMRAAALLDTDAMERRQVIVLPMAAHLPEGTAAALQEWVHRGGTLIVTYFLGIFDRWQRLETGGYPAGLTGLLGIEVQFESRQTRSFWMRNFKGCVLWLAAANVAYRINSLAFRLPSANSVPWRRILLAALSYSLVDIITPPSTSYRNQRSVTPNAHHDWRGLLAYASEVMFASDHRLVFRYVVRSR